MRSEGIKLLMTKSKSNSNLLAKEPFADHCCTRSLLTESPFSVLRKMPICIQNMAQLSKKIYINQPISREHNQLNTIQIYAFECRHEVYNPFQ